MPVTDTQIDKESERVLHSSSFAKVTNKTKNFDNHQGGSRFLGGGDVYASCEKTGGLRGNAVSCVGGVT